jgi:hypothetical protein
MRRLAFIGIVTCLMPFQSIAAKPADELIEIAGGKPVAWRADRAYLLFRVPRPQNSNPLEPLLMRVPNSDEVARYDAARAAAFAKALPDLTKAYQRALEQYRKSGAAVGPPPAPPSLENFAFSWDEVANLQDVDFGRKFARNVDEETFLVEALPGDYILYGFTPSTGLPRLMVCMCLGTVGFSAKAGEVTDLGYLISDYAFEASQIPELRGEGGYSATVRPARAESTRAPGLAEAPVVPATYRAVGRFFTPNAVNIARLARVPGVLEYAGGKVIDAGSGQSVPDNF